MMGKIIHYEGNEYFSSKHTVTVTGSSYTLHNASFQNKRVNLSISAQQRRHESVVIVAEVAIPRPHDCLRASMLAHACADDDVF